MVDSPKLKDGWVGIWLIPFAILTSTITTVIMYAMLYGAENLREGRIIFILVVGGLLLVVSVVLGGWGARQAVAQVYPGGSKN